MVHAFWQWVYFNAPTLQSIFALGALIGLAVYAYDTKKLVRASRRQIESTVQPILGISVRGREIIATNIGNGPALNVRFLEYKGVCVLESKCLPVLGKGDSVSAGTESDFIFSNLGVADPVFEVQYESTSGTNCRSLATWKKGERAYITTMKIIGPEL